MAEKVIDVAWQSTSEEILEKVGLTADKITLDLVYEELKKYNDSKKEYYPSDDLIETIYSTALSLGDTTYHYLGTFTPEYDGILKVKCNLKSTSTNKTFNLYVMSQGENKLNYVLGEYANNYAARQAYNFGVMFDAISVLTKGATISSVAESSGSSVSASLIEEISYEFYQGIQTTNAFDMYEFIPVSKGRPVHFIAMTNADANTIKVNSLGIYGEVK